VHLAQAVAKKQKTMSKIKAIGTTLSGSISSIIPMFFTVCKSGVCTAACASPIVSLLGISSASLIASPITQSLFPVLLALSAVSFTVSYYKLYVLPKYAKASACDTDCNCAPPTNTFQRKFAVATFWIGLVASTFFFSYFQYQTYKANTAVAVAAPQTATPNATTPATDSTASEEACCSGGGSCN
jgi:hypothetical protein